MIRKIKDRTRARFHLNLSEVAAQNTWQRVVLGFALVGSDRSVVENGLVDVVSSIEAMGLASLAEVQRELLTYGDSPLAETLSGSGGSFAGSFSGSGAPGRSPRLGNEPGNDPGNDLANDVTGEPGPGEETDWDADWIPDSWKAMDAGDAAPPAGAAPDRAGRGRR